MKSNIIPKNTGGYIPPTAPDTATMSQVVALITSGLAGNDSNALGEAACLAATIDYKLVKFADSESGRDHYVLREIASVNRGWGSYIFDSNDCSRSVIEIPHPLFDVNTPEVGSRAYLEAGARALLMAGAHRDANFGGEADMAHNTDTIFETVHEAITTPMTNVIQIHGFSRSPGHPGYPDIVLSAGDGSIPPALAKLRNRLLTKGFTVGVYNGVSWPDLGATTNVQGIYTRSVGGTFIHVELESFIRTNPPDIRVVSSMEEVFGVPSANFTAGPLTGCSPLPVVLTDLSTGDITIWSWDFGDGNVSSDSSTTHTYASGGDYLATLTVTGPCGSDSDSALIHVDSAEVTADFEPYPAVGCVPLMVDFTDSSTGTITSWSWDFGDTTGSSDSSPRHVYSAPGSYLVTLTVSGACDKDSTTMTVHVYPAEVVAAFKATPTSGCAPLTVAFTDYSTGAITSWQWDFGDGGTSSDSSPTHIYTVSGDYTVTLEVSGPCDSDLFSLSIHVNPAEIVADFEATPTSGCMPLNVCFTDLSTGTISSWLWDFGDGETSPDFSPCHSYEEIGNYTVKLTVSGPCDSDTQTKVAYIQVGEPVKADFTADSSSGCVPFTVCFTDSSTGTINSWSWDFGDGNTGSNSSPCHNYTKAGIYTAELTVSGPCGSDSATMEIEVKGLVEAAFSVDQTWGCFPFTVCFTDLSTGPVTGWALDFGDGKISTDSSPCHTYTQPGLYTAKLTVTGPCNSDTAEVQIQVYGLVEASFTPATIRGCVPLEVCFDDGSSGPITSWAWDFGDANTSSDSSPCHTFTKPGVYTVELTVTGPCNSDTAEVSIQVDPVIEADFRADPLIGCVPLEVCFTDSSAGVISAWSWDFGDGNFSSDSSPCHTYTAPGTYRAILSVRGTCGQDSKTISIQVEDRPEAAFFGFGPGSEPFDGSMRGCVPLTVCFTDVSTGSITSWSWDFGDGSASSDSSPCHTFTTPGTYPVKLTVGGMCGSDSTTVNIQVDPMVEAAFETDVSSGCVPLTVCFTDVSTGGITSLAWDFGDGNFSSDPSACHTYTTAGSYTVELTVSGDCGLDSATRTVEVKDIVKADFTANPLRGCSPLAVHFTDLSTGDITSWSWGFGDGAISSDSNPVHVYNAPGIYTISLYVQGECGTDYEVKIAYIEVLPGQVAADFTAGVTSGCAPLTVAFTDLSIGAITNWSWDFGDGETSSDSSPSHYYPDAGIYPVELTVWGECGTDTHQTVIELLPGGVLADFNVSQDDICDPSIDFTDNSKGQISSWSWDFGDGDNSPAQNPSHTYEPGVYTATLVVSGQCGEDSSQVTITVAPCEVDLAVYKWCPWQGQIAPGAEMTYGIWYSHHGDITAENVVVVDTLPVGVTFVKMGGGDTVREEPEPSIEGQVLTWNLGSLAPDEYGYLQFVVEVASGLTPGTELCNEVTIASSIEDVNPEDNQSDPPCCVMVATPVADILVNKWGPWEAPPGEEMDYYLSVRNQGNVSAEEVILIDTLPPRVSYVEDESGVTPTVTGSGFDTDPFVVTWNLGSIGPEEWRYFPLTVLVTPEAPYEIVNTATVKVLSGEPDPEYNNTSRYTTHIGEPRVDLGIYKWGPWEASPGMEITYSIWYWSGGNVSVDNVSITDFLPAEVDYVSDNSGITPVIVDHQITWSIGRVKLWQGGGFEVVVRVHDVADFVTLNNLVRIESPDKDVYPRNNENTHITRVVPPTTDLAIYKSGPQSTVPNHMIEYHLWYQNRGTITAEDVEIIDSLPDGVTYISDNSGVSPSFGAHQVRWPIGNLAPGAYGYFAINVWVGTVPVPSMLVNTVSIQSPTLDDDPSNNQVSQQTEVVWPVTDLWVYKSGPDKVSIGYEMTFQVTYGNRGNDRVQDVTLIDRLPEGLEYVRDTSGLPRSESGRDIIWAIDRIRENHSYAFELTLRVTKLAGLHESITNKMEIALLPTDPNPANNISAWPAAVVDERADVAVTKYGTGARPGFDKTYYLTYGNEGTGEASNVIISDILPPEVTYLASNPVGSYDSTHHLLTWFFSSLMPQDEATARITVNVPVPTQLGTELVNTSQIMTASLESDLTNNTYQERETVFGSIDPNDIMVSPQGWIAAGQTLEYVIHFENIPETYTVEAIFVTVEDQLDPEVFDLETLKWGKIHVGTEEYTLDNYDDQRKPGQMGPATLEPSYDQATGKIRWYFRNIDLVPNHTPPEGEGAVSFSIKTKSGLPTGTIVRNEAQIQFDYNEWLKTPPVENRIDVTPPTSKVNRLPEYTLSTSFEVNWQGNDAESGIGSYSLFYAEDDGADTCWLGDTTAVSATFTGEVGHTYSFYCLAKDKVGNAEKKTPLSEAEITILDDFRVELEDGRVIGDLSLNLGDTLAVYAKGYIGDSVVGPLSVTWEITGGIGSLTTTEGKTTTFKVEHAGIGRISARFDGQERRSGEITVKIPPGITILEPNGVDDKADTAFTITWAASDMDDNASISLYYDTNDTGYDGIAITTGLKEESDTSYPWDVSEKEDGEYWIYAIITDGKDTIRAYSAGPVTISHVVEFETYNYPNPFYLDGREVSAPGITTDGTIIKYALPERVNNVSLKIYTIVGELVKEFSPDELDNERGKHYVAWDGKNDHGKTVASGVYIYRLEAGSYHAIRKIALIR
ncbi:MAG: PKD domain-containing protein [bacterium]|nr:PKD domain-containing protein [bacterium]